MKQDTHYTTGGFQRAIKAHNATYVRFYNTLHCAAAVQCADRNHQHKRVQSTEDILSVNRGERIMHMATGRQKL